MGVRPSSSMSSTGETSPISSRRCLPPFRSGSLQLELLATNDFRLAPEGGRVEPRLWVRRFVIWKNRDTIIREVTLRPGLNIVWSPDPADQKGDATALGHG